MCKVDWQSQPQHRRPVVATAPLSTLSVGKLPSSTWPGWRGRVQGKEQAPRGQGVTPHRRTQMVFLLATGASEPNERGGGPSRLLGNSSLMGIQSYAGLHSAPSPVMNTHARAVRPRPELLLRRSVANGLSRPHIPCSLDSLIPRQNL